jgi:diacylglycerol O-acyltransferase / wax synthase
MGRLSPLNGKSRTNLKRMCVELDVRARGWVLVDRPSALDLAFLDLETPRAPLHVGWTLRFGGDAPPVAALRRHLDARLGAVPRFRRVLRRPGPVWADDPAFAIARHVFGVGAARGTALREVAGTLLSQPLPEDRPLWRMYLVDGAEDGFAIIGQAHHALIDGVAAIAVARLLFGPEGDAVATWVPAPAPSAGAVARATGAARTRALAAAARDAAGALWPDAPAASSAERAAAALRTARGLTAPREPTAFERSASARRAVAYASVDFASVRAAGRARGATVNDLLLAATSVALRAALRRRAEPREALRALVPVSVRGDEAGDALGNRISFLPVALPVGEPDPHRALALIAARTAAAKAGGDAGALEALGRAADALPGAGRRLVARSALRALALLGRPLRAVHPMVPLLAGHALSIGAVSYDGRLQLGVAADAEVVEDAVEIARDLEAAFDALRAAPAPAAASGSAESPWRARARERRAQRAANR